ncbi:hypothetical protein AMAG_18709 [Allomyces macrogynus ATCC 38327]|uniref:TmcB/TmcC TPR repeats domain-containing protein n=1 Tax=Allomyces macrogynus (strain ATCC 38327) TaxID=578462 RepID=A0A0L0SEH0_ALLM3|nr:hypothetical protein AMAG_18709 [Allomyces macrogynus ATCC 38327]|eukprot:KNE60928.1 hypothetical protein AMAG_18709 [Allomyces macrogynus ATCC 38327]
MRLLQRAQSLYFELAYSLTAENHLLDRLEAFSTILEFFQVAAFIFSPHYSAWNATDFQDGLQIALLSFDQVAFDYFYDVAILAMLLAFISLVVQISRKGGITQFRILQLARFLVGVLGSFMFMPIVENGIHATYAYLIEGDTHTRTLPMLLVLDTTIVVSLLVPTFAMAYLQGPDYRRLTAFSHPSSRQHVLLLASKVVMSVAYGLAPTGVFPFVLLACLLGHLVVSLYLPPYFSLISNLIWAGQQTALIFGALCLSVLAHVPSLAGTGDDPAPLFWIATIGMIPAGALGGAVFFVRSRSLLSGLSVWTAATAWLRRGLRRLLRRGPPAPRRASSASAKPVELPSDVPPFSMLAHRTHAASLLHRCKYPLDVVFAANTLYVTFGNDAAAYILELLARGTKKWPESEVLAGTWIALAAALGDHSVQQKTYIQGLIRKTVAKRITALDTRFGFYSIIKNFEISVFRQQGEDTRRLDVLDIIRYHYNYTEAMKHYLAVLKWSRQFWKVCSQDRVAVDTLGFIADMMQDHQTAALHHYRALLERFPSSVAILRSYAAFIMDCVNNEQLGEEILEFAERLEEDRVTSVAPAPVAAVRAPAAKSAAAGTPELAAVDDARSEHSASRYSSATSSDVMSSINAQSIFDVASLDEQRNHVAMATLTAMRTAIRYSLVVLVVLGMLLYPLGTGFVSTVASSSQTIFDSGTLRRYMNVGAQALRNLQLGALSTTNTTTIAALQAPVLTAAETVYTSLNTVFYQTTQSLDDQLVQYLTTGTTLTDKAFARIATKLSPLGFMEFFYLALYWGGLISPTTVATDSNVAWGIANSQPSSFFDLVQGVVAAYQGNYEANVRLRANSLQIAAMLATLVPLLVFILFFIPKWLRLRRELEATTSLFARIPRKVAGILAADMKERIQSKLESEGMIDVGGARTGGRFGATTGATEPDHDLDDRAGTSGKESHAHQTLAMRVLLVYLGAFILALMVVIAFTMCLVQPIWMMFERGSLVNYIGMRLSIVLRIQYETLELARLPAGDPMRDVWKAALTEHLDLLGSVHNSVLYGNAALGLPRTVGLVPGADAATFAPSCSLGIPCLSLDEAITFLTTRVRLIMQNPSGATWLDLAQIAEIASLDGNFATRTATARIAFMSMNESTINSYQTAATAIFASMFPLSLIVAYFLIMTARTVRDRIRRTRNILFQLPTDTIQGVPAIRDYLSHGTIEAALPSRSFSKDKDKSAKFPATVTTAITPADEYDPCTADKRRDLEVGAGVARRVSFNVRAPDAPAPAIVLDGASDEEGAGVVVQRRRSSLTDPGGRRASVGSASTGARTRSTWSSGGSLDGAGRVSVESVGESEPMVMGGDEGDGERDWLSSGSLGPPMQASDEDVRVGE